METITFNTDLNKPISMSQEVFRRLVFTTIEFAIKEKEYDINDLTVEFIAEDISGLIDSTDMKHEMNALGLIIIKDVLNDMKSPDELILIKEIADRAEKLCILAVDRFTFIMDMIAANKEFYLRLDELLEADNLNFSHDVVGIQQNLNRLTGNMDNSFIPRFASFE